MLICSCPYIYCSWVWTGPGVPLQTDDRIIMISLKCKVLGSNIIVILISHKGTGRYIAENTVGAVLTR